MKEKTGAMQRVSDRKKSEIGRRIRLERERLGYSSKQMAMVLAIPIEHYDAVELGQADPGMYALSRLATCGFDVHFIVTAQRHLHCEDEHDLISRFRELSKQGKQSVMMTLEALKRLRRG